MSAASPAEEIPAAEYGLFVREDSARLYLKNNDEGVYLSPKGVGWFIGGASRTRSWSDIVAVHLVVAHLPKNGPIGTCRIVFRDGCVLQVLSASKWGHSDDERNAEYGRFLTDFHRAIPREARGSIAFGTGFSKGRHIGMIVTLVIAALFFLGLPVGLALYLRSFEALLIAGAGAAFVWPLYRVTEAAAPASYDPGYVPPEFFP